MQPTSRRERRAASRQAGAGPSGTRPGSVRPARPNLSRTPRPAWQSPFVLVTAGAVVVMAVLIGALLLSQGRPDGGTSEGGLVRPPDNTYARFAQGDALGPADAPVVLEVWSDYQCPVCGRFATEYLPRLVNDYVAGGSLRIVERSIVILDPPGGSESLDAAAGAACAAREGVHWAFHDYLFWNQEGENEGAFRRERLVRMAERVGLDAGSFSACLDDAGIRSEILDRTREALDSGIDRTPTFEINGERIVGLPAYADLAAAIEAQLEAAG